ncbi:hypothetical protein ABPG72_017664 [Tetrahymena utriculariae]
MYQYLLNQNNIVGQLLKKLQNENKSLLEDNENLKKVLKERENYISDSQTVSKKTIQEKEQEIIDLKAKVEIKSLEVENLKNDLQNLKNLNLSFLQKQDSLQVKIQEKDSDILQIQSQLQNLESQKKCFLENQDRAQQEIQQLKEIIKENQDSALKKIQELEEKIQLNSQGKQGDGSKIQIPQLKMTQELKKDNIPQQMSIINIYSLTI